VFHTNHPYVRVSASSFSSLQPTCKSAFQSYLRFGLRYLPSFILIILRFGFLSVFFPFFIAYLLTLHAHPHSFLLPILFPHSPLRHYGPPSYVTKRISYVSLQYSLSFPPRHFPFPLRPNHAFRRLSLQLTGPFPRPTLKHCVPPPLHLSGRSPPTTPFPFLLLSRTN